MRRSHILSVSDYVLASLSLLVLALEFTSDNQQWSFQVSIWFTAILCFLIALKNFKHKGVINPNEWPGARLQWTEDDRQRGGFYDC